MTLAQPTQLSSGPADRVPLSMQQEFLCLFDKGDTAGPFGPRYSVVDGWRLRGEVHLGALQGALDDIVRRHEALRTVVVRDAEPRYQQVFPAAPVRLELRDLGPDVPAHPAGSAGGGHRDVRAEEFLNEIECEPVSPRAVPLISAVLGRFDRTDGVLVLAAHHTAVDGWSMQVLMRDLAACYAARRGLGGPDLPVVEQYREFAVRQRAAEAAGADGPHLAFWREKLAGARITPIRTDRDRSAHPDFATGWHRFAYGPDARTETTRGAAKLRGSLFMTLLGAFEVLLHQQTGATDVVVPTFTPGRAEARLQGSVGSFFNFLPLRVDLAGARTFRDVVDRTKASCLEAYSHELPLPQILAAAPELMVPAATDGLAACVFQVIQYPFLLHRWTVGDLEYTALRKRMISQPVGSDIPDGALWCLELEPDGDLIGTVGHSTNLLDRAGVARMVTDYGRLLRRLVAEPDAPLPRA